MIFFTSLTLCLRALVYKIREVPGLYSGALTGRICLEQKKAVANTGRSRDSEKEACDYREHHRDVERAPSSSADVVTLLAQFSCHCSTLWVACLRGGDGFRQGSLCVARLHHLFPFCPALRSHLVGRCESRMRASAGNEVNPWKGGGGSSWFDLLIGPGLQVGYISWL